MLSDWRAELLQAVAEAGSLAGAASKLKVPYRIAWGKIKEMEERLGWHLVESERGGRTGGQTQLTPQAKELLRRYREFDSGLREELEERFYAAFGEQESPPQS